MNPPRRIGLMGGSFDPPHLAHLALGRAARAQLALDELRWLPAGAPWQKAGRVVASPAHRGAMLAALLQDDPGSVIDTRELQRDGATYTIDTVRALQAEVPDAEWFLVIGQDQYARFDTWQAWPELLQRLTLAVAARDGQAPTPPAALAAVPHRCVTIELPAMAVSASAVRQRLAAGLPVTDLVGSRVAGYIDQQRPYPGPQQQG
ncbi:nicotinate-nucleotide adenylyltransferase [Ideonella sp. DXS22W]|uniref:Probable nicotinate-nucleotide adenylyltransferase n=1 Tax=Pseudaquabacterium inlustre TaxID=2984192 RepID=A0ABU9CJR4_9BURK